MTFITDTEQARGSESAPRSEPSPPSRPSRRVAFGWAAVIVALVAAIALAITVLQSDGSSTPSDGVPTTARQFPQGVLGSADAAERWLTTEPDSAWPQGVPGSADTAERWASERPERNNDAACRQLSDGKQAC